MNEEQPLSVGQEALWFVHRMAPDSAAYNVALSIRISSPLNVPVLTQAVQATAQRHDALRSFFTEVEGRPRRVIGDGDRFRLDVHDVPGVDEEQLRLLARDVIARPFALAVAGAARIVLLRRAPDDAVLILVAHHITMDFPSQTLVLRELLDAYRALLTGKAPTVLNLPTDRPRPLNQRFTGASHLRCAGAPVWTARTCYRHAAAG
jgi:Condensation domain